MRERWIARIDSLSERAHHSRHQRRCTFHCDLLSQNGAYGELESIERTRYTNAGNTIDAARQPVRGEMSIDYLGIGVEVEEVANARRDRLGVTRQTGADLENQRRGIFRIERDTNVTRAAAPANVP